MRLHTLLTVSLLASTIVFAQGCAAESSEDDAAASEEQLRGSASQDRLIDVPAYFGVPKTAMSAPLHRAAYPYPTVYNRTSEVADTGLRLIAVQQGSGTGARASARRDMAKRLAASGDLQAGDIVLAFRGDELADTMAYPHIQMGTTHASLTWTDEGGAHNIDSPLDTTFTGRNARFDTTYFVGGTTPAGVRETGLNTVHIVRPRGFNDGRRASLNTWSRTLLDGLPRINGERNQVKFQSDYLAPVFATQRLTTKQTVTKLGKIILEADTVSKLPMYCSEFAWHMLALSNCSAEEIRSAPAEGAACVDPKFTPMPLVGDSTNNIGLAEGPLQSILLAPPGERPALIGRTFGGSNPGKLSSGHRAVAEQVAPLMQGLSQYYGARAQGATPEMAAGAAGQLNAALGNVTNYSPTAFLVQAVRTDAARPMDYVATVAFVDGPTYERAKLLARTQKTSGVIDGESGIVR